MASFRQLVRSKRRDLVVVQRGEGFCLASASKLNETKEGVRDVAVFGNVYPSVEQAALVGKKFGYEPENVPLWQE